MTESEGDSLRRLQNRLDQASGAAERLLIEAMRAAGAGREGSAAGAGEGGGESPPAAGWQLPGSAQAASELERLMVVIRAARDLIPAELQVRLAEAVRELLLALRALIDWCLERSERHRRTPAAIEEIPIL